MSPKDLRLNNLKKKYFIYTQLVYLLLVYSLVILLNVKNTQAQKVQPSTSTISAVEMSVPKTLPRSQLSKRLKQILSVIYNPKEKNLVPYNIYYFSNINHFLCDFSNTILFIRPNSKNLFIFCIFFSNLIRILHF